MGGGDYVEHQNLVSLVPEIALCAIDRIEKLKLKTNFKVIWAFLGYFEV